MLSGTLSISATKLSIAVKTLSLSLSATFDGCAKEEAEI